MKKKFVIVSLFFLLIVSACQSNQLASATPLATLPPSPTIVLTPKGDEGSAKGRIVSLDGTPYADTIIRFAQVEGNGDNLAFTLDMGHAPGTLTDSDGNFVITNIPYQRYVIIIGDPEGKYFIINDNNDNAVVYTTRFGEVFDLGELKIDFKP